LPFALRFRGGGLSTEAAEVLASADVVVSSHPPWPVHVAGWLAARRFAKPWVADYRDQWSDNHMFPGTALSAALERRLERKLLSRAAAVTVVSSPMEAHYRGYHPRVVTIENGYDAEAFDRIRSTVVPAAPEPGASRTLRYMGTITRDRIPRNLFAAMRALPAATRDRLRVEFYGDCRLLAVEVAASFGDLAPQHDFRGEVPHAEALRLMLTADALLFVENSSFDSLSAQGVLTTKIFEYLASGRPIVADIDPATLAGGVIARSGLGLAVSRDPAELGRALAAVAAGGVELRPDVEYVGSFSREAQTRRLETLLGEVVREHAARA
jgi:glycosyltransferase involved in cell wall biosynthesis